MKLRKVKIAVCLDIWQGEHPRLKSRAARSEMLEVYLWSPKGFH